MIRTTIYHVPDSGLQIEYTDGASEFTLRDETAEVLYYFEGVHIAKMVLAAFSDIVHRMETGAGVPDETRPEEQ